MQKKKHKVTEAFTLSEFDKYKDYMEKALAIRIETWRQ